MIMHASAICAIMSLLACGLLWSPETKWAVSGLLSAIVWGTLGALLNVAGM